MNNQALAYSHSDVMEGISKYPNALNQTLLTNVEEVLTLENYWREVLQSADDNLKLVANNEIKKLREILISRTNLTHDLLQSKTTSETKADIIVVEKPNNKKETKVVSIATGKEVIPETTEQVVAEQPVVEPIIEPVVNVEPVAEAATTVAEETKTETTETMSDVIESISIQDIRTRATELVRDNKKDEALEYAKYYLMTGNYLPNPGKKVHNWKEKELNGWFKDLCERASETPKLEVKKEEPVAETTSTVDKSKAANDKKAGAMLDFSKPKLIEAEEELAFIDLANTLLKLKEENKDNEVESTLNLFFLDPVVHPLGRGYNNLQKFNWWNAVQANNAPLENNLVFIKNASIKKEINTPHELFEEGKKLIEEGKSEKEVADWFTETTQGKQIQGIDADFSSLSVITNWFKNMFGHFFRKEESAIKKEEMDQKTTEEIVRLLQSATETTSLIDVVKDVKTFLRDNKVNMSLPDLKKKVDTLAQEHNPELYKKHEEKVKEIKDSKIQVGETKVNEKFDVKDRTNTMKHVFFFDPSMLKYYTKLIARDESFEKAVEFAITASNEGRVGNLFSKQLVEGDGNTAVVKGWVKFTDDEIRDWVKEETKDLIQEAEIVTEEEVEVKPEVVEPTEETTTEPVTETPAEPTTTEEVVEPVVETPNVEPTTVEPEVTTPETTEPQTVEPEVTEPEILLNEDEEPDFSEVLNSTSRKEFETSVSAIIMKHKERKTLRSELMNRLKNAPNGALGKYARNIRKNKEGDIHKMLNNIENNLQTVSTT